MIKMNDVNLKNKRILIRSDFNVPIKYGKIVSDIRIKAALPTINMAIKNGGKVMVTSHIGNPTEEKYESKLSLQPVVNYLHDKLNYPVRLVRDYLNGIDINTGELIVLENVRFNKGELTNNATLAKKYAALCDIFIMDAFGSAHRIQASTYGIGEFVPIACAGLLLSSELDQLNKILNFPSRPMVAIIGGAKISTKLKVLSTLVDVVDQLIIGGSIANTFLAAQGYKVSKLLYEPSLIAEAKHLLKNDNIILPKDVHVGNEFSKHAVAVKKENNQITFDDYIMDLGNLSVMNIVKILKKSKTILWNGPLGVFEFINFRNGTEIIARTITESNSFSIIGGGETLAISDILGISNKISYISTGGGSLLKYIENRKLPAVSMLENFTK